MRYLSIGNLIRAAAASFFLIVAQPAGAELVGFWNFDDETANDLSGFGNNGEVMGLDFSDDVPDQIDAGRSLNVFDNGTVLVPHSDSLFIADTMSIAFWMKANNDDQASNWNGPMAKRSEPRESGGWEFQRFDDQSRLDIRIDTDAGANAVRGNVTGTFDGEWVHVVWTVDSGQWASYKDGELVVDGDYPHGEGFANEFDFSIGDRGGCCGYTGLLDEIALYNNVISEETIMNLAAGIPPLMPRENLGDFNEDGVVDTADFDIMTSNFNQKFPVLESYQKGDFNQNGRVDLRDFVGFREVFGEPAAAVASVPEPLGSTLAVSAFVGMALLCRNISRKTRPMPRS